MLLATVRMELRLSWLTIVSVFHKLAALYIWVTSGGNNTIFLATQVVGSELVIPHLL